MLSAILFGHKNPPNHSFKFLNRTVTRQKKCRSITSPEWAKWSHVPRCWLCFHDSFLENTKLLIHLKTSQSAKSESVSPCLSLHIFPPKRPCWFNRTLLSVQDAYFSHEASLINWVALDKREERRVRRSRPKSSQTMKEILLILHVLCLDTYM